MNENAREERLAKAKSKGKSGKDKGGTGKAQRLDFGEVGEDAPQQDAASRLLDAPLICAFIFAEEPDVDHIEDAAAIVLSENEQLSYEDSVLDKDDGFSASCRREHGRLTGLEPEESVGLEPTTGGSPLAPIEPELEKTFERLSRRGMGDVQDRCLTRGLAPQRSRRTHPRDWHPLWGLAPQHPCRSKISEKINFGNHARSDAARGAAVRSQRL